jgi:hypothetical protein
LGAAGSAVWAAAAIGAAIDTAKASATITDVFTSPPPVQERMWLTKLPTRADAAVDGYLPPDCLDAMNVVQDTI